MSEPTGPAPTPTSGFIFRASITRPDGTVIYAKQFGKRAFKIPVDPNDEEKKLDG